MLPECTARLMFQSYQSRQINPDMVFTIPKIKLLVHTFQSYQSRQINPDPPIACRWHGTCAGFNRINPDRSIPTRKRVGKRRYQPSAVSIVSIQTDQSRRSKKPMRKEMNLRSFNRINPDRSIPTWQNVDTRHDY